MFVRLITATLLSTLALSVSAATTTASTATIASTTDLQTFAEKTNFAKTGRYAEVIQLCAAYQRTFPKAVRCEEFGRTPEGRPMLALIATRTGAFTPQAAQQRKLPVLLVQGGIHAGEIDGKDAGFIALREALQNTAAKGALDKQVLIFVPVFNIDGHERFGAWNRPNQNGPDEMGWRTTAQNYNLNRDYVKADSPEMQAMLRLINHWDPLATIDLHVTDGAKFEHDVSIQVEPGHAGDLALRTIGLQFRDQVISDLAKQGALPLPFYMSFDVDDDPSFGFVERISPPRFSTGYFQLRNRFGMLVETHSWKDYASRVRITHNTVISVLEQIAEHGAAWRKVAMDADATSARLAGKSLAVSYKATDKVRQFAFRGYEYTRTPSDISGALMTHYDDTKPQIWNVPVRDEIVEDEHVTAPQAGYLIPAAYAKVVAEKLAQHGVRYQIMTKALDNIASERFATSSAQFNPKFIEGHATLTLKGQWQPAQSSVTAGALFVPIAQAKSRLVVELFEPKAKDTLVFWGLFNNVFEKKEYMEAYVAEDVARAQLAASPALAEEFKQKLANDPAFAKDPDARLEFFYCRHSSWDQRYQQYPVLRLDQMPSL